MPAIETSSAAGGALIKFFGVPVVAGAVATTLTFMFMWPRTRREAFIRIATTIICSAMLGPILIMALHSWWPSLFASAGELAVLAGLDPALGLMFAAAPILALAGLPAWWVLGAIVLWLERRRGKDIGEIAHDAVEVVKDVKGVL